MFSGLVQAIGEVAAVRRTAGGMHMRLRACFNSEALVLGESVAVQGVCVTVVTVFEDGFAADLSPETLARTTLSEFKVGRRVNLERALKLGDRLGGHLVSGHVDAAVEVIDVRTQHVFRTLRLALPSRLAPEVARKGSVAVDGVSLTVADVGEGWFEVALVPATLQATTLGECRPGDRVNLETDVLAKYVRRAVAGEHPSVAELWGGHWHAED